MLNTQEELEALEVEIVSIVERAAGEAADYAAEFAAYAADAIAGAVRRGDPKAVERLEAMSLTVAETITELGDQAANEVVTTLSEVARVLIALARVSSGPTVTLG